MASNEPGPDPGMDVGEAFIEKSRAYLQTEYLPKIRGALQVLDEEDFWWRPNDASNSVGNLVLHLAGNVRQWVVSGIGGAKDVRERAEEFRLREGLSVQEGLDRLEAALEEVDETLASLPVSCLEEERVIQGLRVTVLEALYHVVEHFSMHTGQILLLAKLRSGQDLGFYRIEDGTVVTRW